MQSSDPRFVQDNLRNVPNRTLYITYIPYTCTCSAKFSDLRIFKIALHKLKITKLQKKFEMGTQF